MLKKILYYGKENNKKTVRSIIVLFLSVIFQIAPFYIFYNWQNTKSPDSYNIIYYNMCSWNWHFIIFTGDYIL